MPDQFLRSSYITAEGPLILNGATLTGIVVTTGYVFSPSHEYASTPAAYEVAPASDESRFTATAAVTLAEDATGWLVTITGTTALDLSDVTNRGGIVWVIAGPDVSAPIVGFCADIGGADAAYLPTWPDGLYIEDINPHDGGGGPVSDEDVAVEAGTAPLLHSGSAVAAWEGAAAYFPVSDEQVAAVSTYLPGFVTHPGTDQEQINDNSGAVHVLALIQAAIAGDAVAVARLERALVADQPPAPGAWAKCGDMFGFWACPTTIPSPTDTLRIRVLSRFVTASDTAPYSEMYSESLDGDGIFDRFEIADRQFDASDLVIWGFFEWTEIGAESEQWIAKQGDVDAPDASLAPVAPGIPGGVWVEREMFLNMATGTCTMRLRLASAYDYTDPDDNTPWLTLFTYETGAPTSLEATAGFDQWIGRGGGEFDVARVRRWDDDVLVLDFNPSDDGATTVADSVLESAPGVPAVWTATGTAAVEEAPSPGGGVALGETSSTAYRGDRGKTAYDHSQATSGNPHNVTKTDVGLANVTNVAQVEAKTTGAALWIGTQSAYDALGTWSSTTVYVVTP